VGIESHFDHSEAARQLADYQRNGPAKTTTILLGALKAAGVEGRALLDIGGGIGAIQLELLKAGVSHAISVEASSAYLEVARQEAERQRLQDLIQFRHGDFVKLAEGLPSADIVTLDRSLCCYPNMPALVGLSASHARRLYGLVYPRDAWWVRLALGAENGLRRLQRNPFRALVHPARAVETLLREQGLQCQFYRVVGVWQIAVYKRGQ
jgi:magnesium-protoporphyrin O-methyltransferase